MMPARYSSVLLLLMDVLLSHIGHHPMPLGVQALKGGNVSLTDPHLGFSPCGDHYGFPYRSAEFLCVRTLEFSVIHSSCSQGMLHSNVGFVALRQGREGLRVRAKARVGDRVSQCSSLQGAHLGLRGAGGPSKPTTDFHCPLSPLRPVCPGGAGCAA